MGRLGRFFRYKVFVDALFHSEVMSIFNLPIDNRYFMLHCVLSHKEKFGWLIVTDEAKFSSRSLIILLILSRKN